MGTRAKPCTSCRQEFGFHTTTCSIFPAPQSQDDQIKEAWKEGWRSGLRYREIEAQLNPSSTQSPADQFFTIAAELLEAVKDGRASWKAVKSPEVIYLMGDPIETLEYKFVIQPKEKQT